MPIRIGIGDQRIALPYFEAVRPAVGVQFGQGPQERVGEPARLAGSPAATARVDPRMTVDRNPRRNPGVIIHDPDRRPAVHLSRRGPPDH
jgi:hypothetical protein